MRNIREFVDFSHVEPHQADMHERLKNWARACRSSGADSASPMFRLYRSNDHWQPGGYAATTTVPVDQRDATFIAVAVQRLPEPHMHATNWAYLTRGDPMTGRRKLGCTAVALQRYVRDARQMLINRGV